MSGLESALLVIGVVNLIFAIEIVRSARARRPK